jgi:hypothetical protein
MPAGESKSKRPKGPPNGAARKRAAQGVSLVGALAEATWTEADAALAQALVELDEAEGAASKSDREDALTRLAQSLSRAARKRGLSRIGALGETETYDAARHELNTPVAKTPKKVRIQARGVARGDEILERPRVTPSERKRRE